MKTKEPIQFYFTPDEVTLLLTLLYEQSTKRMFSDRCKALVFKITDQMGKSREVIEATMQKIEKLLEKLEE
jgi:hypothetical protein